MAGDRSWGDINGSTPGDTNLFPRVCSDSDHDALTVTNAYNSQGRLAYSYVLDDESSTNPMHTIPVLSMGLGGRTPTPTT